MKSGNRPLTEQERTLVRWMLEDSGPDAAPYLQQLQHATVTPWKCDCGCASIDFSIDGNPKPLPGLNITFDYVFIRGEHTYGIFVFINNGILGGLDAYQLTGDSPRTLPDPSELRPF